ncbi:MAG: Universal stress protein [Euryarchaeota archaeon ADurb.BinA087]|nr:universal stress protein [Methanoregulaceae archaeon]OPZ45036.1 MAG: Universal stress protein [Euryarchaeota archaeon ADurb.BinA087]HPX72388.1 universal stress protein [Methanoregulaceae archaeon]HQA79404.1 universal stress protein [Methanoregulaceae archaeon]
MFHKLLFATDFSEYAKKTLDCIAGFPGVAEVIVLHVLEEARNPRGGGEINETLTPDERNLLKEEKHRLESLNKRLKVTTRVKTSSDVPGAIIETAEENGVTLIVVGARGNSIVEGILLGSVSVAIVRRSKITVLVMRHKIMDGLQQTAYDMWCPMIFSRILCPIDFSVCSDRAITLLKTTNGVGQVILFHVVSHGESETELETSVEEASRKLAEIGKDLSRAGVNVRILVKRGNPGSEITRIADEEGVSVIWISSLGKGWFRELLLGSTAYDVAMNARQPVIIVRTTKSKRENQALPENNQYRYDVA